MNKGDMYTVFKKAKPTMAVYVCPKCGYKIESPLSCLSCFCSRCSRELVFEKLGPVPGVDPVKAQKKMKDTIERNRKWAKEHYKHKRPK
ncbi:MAG: hypothetical protein WCY09_08070 [Candidatus Omnitrophota bacterium]